ncbi:hypothetical protein Chor_015996 [Crotalus horridus]
MDCVVTEWSQWSPCSHSCSNKNSEGRQSRTTSVLALPGEELFNSTSPAAASQLQKFKYLLIPQVVSRSRGRR